MYQLSSSFSPVAVVEREKRELSRKGSFVLNRLLLPMVNGVPSTHKLQGEKITCPVLYYAVSLCCEDQESKFSGSVLIIAFLFLIRQDNLRS